MALGGLVFPFAGFAERISTCPSVAGRSQYRAEPGTHGLDQTALPGRGFDPPIMISLTPAQYFRLYNQFVLQDLARCCPSLCFFGLTTRLL